MLKTVISIPAVSLLCLAVAGQACAAPAATHLGGQIAQICRVEQSPDAVRIEAHVETQGVNIGRAHFEPLTQAGDVRLSCNVPGSSLRLAASPMRFQDGALSEASSRAGFTDAIDYVASLTGATAFDATARVEAVTGASANPGHATTDHVHYGVYGSTFAMTVGHVSTRDNRKPVAGGYRGVISVTISP